MRPGSFVKTNHCALAKILMLGNTLFFKLKIFFYCRTHTSEFRAAVRSCTRQLEQCVREKLSMLLLNSPPLLMN